MKANLWIMTIAMLGLSTVAFAGTDIAADTPDAGLAVTIDNLFLLLGAILVIFMQAGFAVLESGLNSSKNTVNILTKNVMDFGLGVLLYFLIGYGIMYSGTDSAWFGFDGPVSAPTLGDDGAVEAFTNDDKEIAAGNLHTQVDFLFQAAFAATAATIVSGAVAGRMKFVGYLIYTIVLTGIVYPISGFWKWGGGWLDQMGFYDFAGSIVVHAVGGFAGLAGATVLGPRIGRFGKDKKAMAGHNLTFSALGVFILLIGWFGFNGASQLAIAGLSNTQAVMIIATNTTLAAAAGAVFALITSWIVGKKPDLAMSLNGLLAGLVGITANCDGVLNVEAIIIGAVAGVLVVAGTLLLEAVKIDDPVGAWPVHGLCGLWGGIATGIFGDGDYWGTVDSGAVYGNMGAQITGSLVISAYAFITMFILFSIMKVAGVLRVSEEEEMMGLDLSEHGQIAYGE